MTNADNVRSCDRSREPKKRDGQHSGCLQNPFVVYELLIETETERNSVSRLSISSKVYILHQISALILIRSIISQLFFLGLAICDMQITHHKIVAQEVR